MYNSSARTLLPGLIVGAMFLLLTAASFSMTGSVALPREVADEEADEADSPALAAGTLRIHRGLESAEREMFLVQSAKSVLSKAQEILEEPFRLTAVDRVTLDISLRDLSSNNSEPRGTGRQLAQVVSRRMEALQLRATMRVRRTEDLGQALELAESMLAEGALVADQISIGVDAGMKADTLTIEIVRSIRPIKIREPLL